MHQALKQKASLGRAPHLQIFAHENSDSPPSTNAKVDKNNLDVQEFEIQKKQQILFIGIFFSLPKSWIK